MIKTVVNVSVLLIGSLAFPGSHSHINQKEVIKTPKVVEMTTTTTLVPFNKMVEWSKVAWCETHINWKHEGYLYEGGLGILHSNWAYYGGYQFAPHAWLATPEQQVFIAMKIQNKLPTPDQNSSCVKW
jgi:hypothetical protein